MFTSSEISLVHERNGRLLREVNANRLGKRLRANREAQPGSWRIVGALSPRRFAFPSAGLGRAGGRG